MTTVPESSAAAPRARRRRAAWSLTWRYLVAVFFGLIAFVVVLADGIAAEEQLGSSPVHLVLLMVLDVALGLLSFALLPLRRRAPLVIALVMAAISGFSALSSGVGLIVFVSLATRRRAWQIILVGVVQVVSVLLSGFVLLTTEVLPWWQLLIAVAVYYCICVGIGLYIGNRRDLLESLRQRALLAESEQSSRLDQARVHERTRIAREMHDVLAHRLSLVALHSGALAYRTDLSPEETASTATVVRDNAHLALTELREVLGVLRDTAVPDSVAVEAPQPTLDALPQLLDDNATALMTVDCAIEPTIAAALPRLSKSSSRHAYRIIQECLTNVRKHTVDATATVRVGGAVGDRLTIEVYNPCTTDRDSAVNPAVTSAAATPGSGMGLAGLVERARLAGGELEYSNGPTEFVVKAWLPWTS